MGSGGPRVAQHQAEGGGGEGESNELNPDSKRRLSSAGTGIASSVGDECPEILGEYCLGLPSCSRMIAFLFLAGDQNVFGFMPS